MDITLTITENSSLQILEHLGHGSTTCGMNITQD